MAGGLITYEEKGVPVELVGDRDIAKAVNQGKLRPETIVCEYGADGAAWSGRADGVDRLKPYFAAVEEARASPWDEPAAPAPPASVGRTRRAERLRAEAAAAIVPAVDVEASPEPAEDPQYGALSDEAAHAYAEAPDLSEAPSASSSGGVPWIIAMTVVLGAVLLFAALAGGESPVSAPADNATANAVNAPDPTEAIGTATTYWVNREVRVRRTPGTGSLAAGSLKRGELVRGVQVRGPSDQGDWIRLEEGQFAGSYAWIRNFSTSERPALAMAVTRPRKLAQLRSIFAEPNVGASQLGPAQAGTLVRLVGLTVDGWWEIALDGGGVGYLERETEFGACTGLDCHVLTPDGWGAFRVGLTVEEAEAASATSLVRPGHYDEYFADEPGRLRACNIHQVTGSPANLTAFVQENIVTSLGAGLGEGDSGIRFETERGIALGDSEAAVRAVYGELQEEPDIYSEAPDKKLFYRRGDGKGIKFSIVGGRVSRIDAGGSSINYVEGCL